MHEFVEKNAAAWARVGIANVTREFPHDLRHLVTSSDPIPLPRALHPAFYGSFDWHSCIEMHWMLVRLLRVASRYVAEIEPDIRATLDAHFTGDALTAEARYVAENGGWGRPYGWAWALTLAHELACYDDPDAARWAAAIRPLADVVVRGFVRWLPKTAYPVRYGMHPNSAFSLSRALPYALLAEPELAVLIGKTARQWFIDDVDYPANYEPSGADFLSPALTEAELMSQVLDPGEFSDWLSRFLPGLERSLPAALFEPVGVSDPTDGQIAHLHGLNLSRAWCFRRLANALPDDDPRVAPMREASRRHAEASLPAAAGSDYMVEHWLAAYAVLLLT